MTHEELAYALSCGATLHIAEGLKMVHIDDRLAIKGIAEFMHCFEAIKRDITLIKEVGRINDGSSGGVMMYENNTPVRWCLWLIVDVRSEQGKVTEMRAAIVLADKSLEEAGRNTATQTIDFLRGQIREKDNLQVVSDYKADCE